MAANDGEEKEEATEVVVEEATGLKVWFLTVLVRRTKISPLLELEGGTIRSGGLTTG